ncbi:MAG: hypothetical protein ABL932_12340 [Terricaulis sp.]
MTSLVDSVRAINGSRRCVIYRAEQSLSAGDVYAVGIALQSEAYVQLFPEEAIE